MYIIQLSPKQIKNYHKRGEDQISGRRVKERGTPARTEVTPADFTSDVVACTATHKKQLKKSQKGEINRLE